MQNYFNAETLFNAETQRRRDAELKISAFLR